MLTSSVFVPEGTNGDIAYYEVSGKPKLYITTTFAQEDGTKVLSIASYQLYSDGSAVSFFERSVSKNTFSNDSDDKIFTSVIKDCFPGVSSAKKLMLWISTTEATITLFLLLEISRRPSLKGYRISLTTAVTVLTLLFELVLFKVLLD